MSMKAARPDFPYGLAALAGEYDGLLVDVWGVIHNGVTAFEAASDALVRFRRETGGAVVLVTNAPRPYPPIEQQLAELGVPDEAFDAVVTSGDVTRDLLADLGPKALYHIGPERDLSLYDGLKARLVEPDKAQAISCTGLFDDTVETPEHYRDQLGAFATRGLPFISANPDIVVQRGDSRIFCAGSLAELYEELGGTVHQAGKPHPPIYRLALKRLAARLGREIPTERVLAIGDGLNTDIRGAVGQGLSALLITAGIHEAEFGPPGAPDPDRVGARLAAEGLAARAAMPRLAW
ncbi:TIGR01459 family HAD-type hydrolase [Amorphus orientalis]|uniref:HAD superfamily hydrolase (TIGR01459 family) n=1 Tax=Amorphus orientalis TaxID=649198 RepID=A0AAE3VL74_9HYPH|nr:TIGR01459 family HAD-type hydrolase [Amorphus orientalis]MDQ0313958.1 HAD superfamily hydrolase (TIGR01459 family) [Amorphus orientalis]